MSAKTQNKPAAPSAKTTWLKRFTETLKRLDSAKADVKQKQRDYGTVTTNLGMLLVEHYGVYGSEAYKDEKRQKTILAQVTNTGVGAKNPRTGLKDEPFTWSYVYSWIKGGTILAKVAAERPELKDRMVAAFTPDSLGKIYGVSTNKDLDTAMAFAAERIEKGETSNRAVRAAYDSVVPPKGRVEKTPAQKAAPIIADMKSASKSANAVLKRLKLSPTAIVAVTTFAATVGLTAKDAEVALIVIKDLLQDPTKQ